MTGAPLARRSSETDTVSGPACKYAMAVTSITPMAAAK
jgi:hypothetical protein